MATYDGVELSHDGPTAPSIERGGGREVAGDLGDAAGFQQPTGTPLDSVEVSLLARDLAGFFAAHDMVPLVSVLQALATGPVAGHLGHGSVTLQGVAFAVSAFYRSADRLTIAGYARDLAGNPLRQFQLQFIGETVQDHTFGAGTNLDGIYVAFLDVGDTYTAYAFSPATGITYKLESKEETPNQTNLAFRQITRRLAGDGVFLRSGA